MPHGVKRLGEVEETDAELSHIRIIRIPPVYCFACSLVLELLKHKEIILILRVQHALLIGFSFDPKTPHKAYRPQHEQFTSQTTRKQVALLLTSVASPLMSSPSSLWNETRLVRSNTTCFRGVWLVNCSRCGLQASCGLVGPNENLLLLF